MREILFRGKRIDNGEWVEGHLYITHGGDCEIGKYNEQLDVERYTSVVDPDTVGQYTGQTDKDGRKIFEGDIYEYQDFSEEDDPIVRTEITHDELNMYTLSGEIITGFVVYEYCNGEIIGNIHDNPELLEASQ